jgi:hypothetical protein
LPQSSPPNLKFSPNAWLLFSAACSQQSISHQCSLCCKSFTSQCSSLLPTSLYQKNEWAPPGNLHSCKFFFTVINIVQVFSEGVEVVRTFLCFSARRKLKWGMEIH